MNSLLSAQSNLIYHGNRFSVAKGQRGKDNLFPEKTCVLFSKDLIHLLHPRCGLVSGSTNISRLCKQRK